MVLPKTEAKSIEERRTEIVSTQDLYLRIEKYYPYETLPELKPHNSRPENLRFFPDGIEILVSCGDSNRFIGRELRPENESPINTKYKFQLIDEIRKTILEYTIDAIKGEF